MHSKSFLNHSKLFKYLKMCFFYLTCIFLITPAISLPILAASSGAYASIQTSGNRLTTSRSSLKDVPFGQPGNAGFGKPSSINNNLNLIVDLDFVLKSSYRAFSSPNGEYIKNVSRWLESYHITPKLRGASLFAAIPAGVAIKLLHTNFYLYRTSDTSPGKTSNVSSVSGKRGSASLPTVLTYAFGQPRIPAYLSAELLAVVGLNNAPAVIPSIGELKTPVAAANYSLSNGPTPAKATPLYQDKAMAKPASETVGQSQVSACPTATNYYYETGFAPLSTIGDHYGIAQLLNQGYTGAGVTIGVAELGEANSGDISAYDQCFGLSTGNVSTLNVDGGGTAGLDTLEADADIEQLQTNAPQAKIISYNGPNLDWSTLYDVVNAMVNPPAGDPLPQVISISYGGCESESGDVTALSALFAQAAAQGQSVFVAAGDKGSEECQNETGTLAVSYPGSDPNVTSVGGSNMINSGVTNGSGDLVWNDCQNATSSTCSQSGYGGAGGGGVSLLFGEPAFQLDTVGAIAGSCGSANGDCRAVPDISGNAVDNMVYYDGSFIGVDGTSLSTPLVAAITADIIPTCASPIGDLAPRLYNYYSEFGYQMALNPVTSGNNDWTGAFGGNNYQAKAAYNMATGLGTLDAPFLVCPSVSSLSSSSSPPGSQITVNGNNLGSASVLFGSTPASIISRSNTSVEVVVPNGQGNTTLEVESPIGAGTGVNFAYSNPAITVNAPSTYLAKTGSNVNITVSSYGNPTPVISENGNLPSGIQFNAPGNGTASFSGTLSNASPGSYQISVTATNSKGSQTTSFAILVGNPPSDTAPSDLTVTSGQQLNMTLATGSPQPVITQNSGSSLPSGIALTSQGNIVGTVADGVSGNYTVFFTASNAFGSLNGQLTISVPAPPAPQTTTTPAPVTTTVTTQTTVSDSISLKSPTAIIRGRRILLSTACQSQYCYGNIVISRGKFVLAKSDFRIKHTSRRLIAIGLNQNELDKLYGLSSKKITTAAIKLDRVSPQKGHAHIASQKISRSLFRPRLQGQIRIATLLTITFGKRVIKRERLILSNKALGRKKPTGRYLKKNRIKK